MIRNPSCRVAHTMVRADMYVTWKAARRGALARDVLDDCYHLVNASYCDMYATKDKAQSQYAPSVIGPTKVRYYDGTAPDLRVAFDDCIGIASESHADTPMCLNEAQEIRLRWQRSRLGRAALGRGCGRAAWRRARIRNSWRLRAFVLPVG